MNLNIPNLIFLLGYLIFIGIFCFYAFFNLRQLREYGTNDAKTRLAYLIFIGLTGFLLLVSAASLLNTNWGASTIIDLGAPIVGL